MFLKLGDRIINTDQITAIDLSDPERVHIGLPAMPWAEPGIDVMTLEGDDAQAVRKIFQSRSMPTLSENCYELMS